eukprot:355993-Chlamydomonas_euryale.AAC.6
MSSPAHPWPTITTLFLSETGASSSAVAARAVADRQCVEGLRLRVSRAARVVGPPRELPRSWTCR